MALGWAILGTGRFAASRVAPALNKAHGCKAVAVIGRDRVQAEAFAAEYGIPQAYDSLDAAFSDRRIEAIWVATPHALHRPAVIAAAHAGRHVLCEKPLATTVADARAMIAACRQSGVALGTGFHLRHHPLHLEARRLLAGGHAGPVVSADVEWSLPRRPDSESGAWRWDPDVSGGGVFTATGVHALDLLRFVLQDDIESVAAFLDPLPSSRQVERTAACLLRFRHGTVATVRCSRDARDPANDLAIQCRGASLRALHTLDEQARGTLELSGLTSSIAGLPAGTDLYALQAEAFADAVAQGREPNASGVDGLRAVEATVALYDSAVTSRAISLG